MTAQVGDRSAPTESRSRAAVTESTTFAAVTLPLR